MNYEPRSMKDELGCSKVWRPLAIALLVLTAAACQAQEQPATPAERALARLRLDNLQAVHQAVEELARSRNQVAGAPDYHDYRAAIHVHSNLSHDSPGAPEEILAGAKAAGVSVVMMTEHPSSKADVLAKGLSGIREGVIFIPGAEYRNLLIFPGGAFDLKAGGSQQELVDRVRAGGGLVFLSHPEEQRGPIPQNLDGMEIYNTHAASKQAILEISNMFSSGADPAAAMQALQGFSAFPQEAIAAALDFSWQIVADWSQPDYTRHQRLTGIAANDSHHNIGFVFRWAPGGGVVVEDPLGTELGRFAPGALPLGPPGDPGSVALQVDVDPYPRSFRHASTHLLMKDLTREEVWQALRAGRCYLAFDWIADPTGFAFRAGSATMGDQVKLTKETALKAELPVEGWIRLLQDGKEVIAPVQGQSLTYRPRSPGAYRVEVYQKLAGEMRPWIVSNPIYVK